MFTGWVAISSPFPSPSVSIMAYGNYSSVAKRTCLNSSSTGALDQVEHHPLSAPATLGGRKSLIRMVMGVKGALKCLTPAQMILTLRVFISGDLSRRLTEVAKSNYVNFHFSWVKSFSCQKAKHFQGVFFFALN